MNKIPSAIIDTNLWINYLITNRLITLDRLLIQQKFSLVLSEELIEELIEVAGRPRLRRYFTVSDIDNLLSLMAVHGALFPVHSQVDACRDPKDNFLLALAQDSGADFLVTKDEDLLVLEHFANTRIVDFWAFCAELDT